jgi:formylglycine-generating enzyme required for sulfatase activity
MTMASEYPYDVFVSHSHQDRQLVDDIVAELRQAEGKPRPFIDRTGIRPRSDWRQVLDLAIDGSRLTAVIYTEAASRSEWVRAESERAQRVDRVLCLVPEGKRPPSWLEDRQVVEVGDAGSAKAWAKPIADYLKTIENIRPVWSQHFVLADLASDQREIFEFIEDLERLEPDRLADDQRNVILVVTDQVAEHLVAHPSAIAPLVAKADGSARPVHLLHHRDRRREIPLGLRARRAAVADPTSESVASPMDTLLIGDIIEADHPDTGGVEVAIANRSSEYVRVGPTTVRRGRSGAAIEFRPTDAALMSQLATGHQLLDQHPVTLEQWCGFLNVLEGLGLAAIEQVNDLDVMVHAASGRWLGVDAKTYYAKRDETEKVIRERHGPTFEGGWRSLSKGDEKQPATMMTWWGAAAYAAWIAGEPLDDADVVFAGHYLPRVSELREIGKKQSKIRSATESTSGSETIRTEHDWLLVFGRKGTTPTLGPDVVTQYPVGGTRQRFYSVIGNTAEWCADGDGRGPLIEELDFVPVFGGSYRSPSIHCRGDRGAALVSRWSFSPDRGFRCKPPTKTETEEP